MPFTGARIPADADRSLAESAAWRLWERAARASSDPGGMVFTVNDLCARWLAHAQEYYRESHEAVTLSCGMRTFREMFGNRPVESMTHPDMIELRKRLVGRGLSRVTVNKYMGHVKRMAAWATDERLMSPQVKAELTAISPLKRNRSAARETAPVGSVPDDVIEKTCARLPRSLADMVRVHRLTGMRPDEVCRLAWPDIERREDVWVFRPGRHKEAWRNLPRVVVIGPRAQRILGKYAGDGFVFTPQMSVDEHYREAIEAAKCHRPPEKVGGAPRRVGERWETGAYARAVGRAAEAAGVPHWHPNQLRHSCATAVRRRFGIAAAGAVLGHSQGLRITDRYSFEAAEDEAVAAAAPAMLEMG
jgi:integrase